METILFAIGVIAISLVWRYMWRPTILGHTRDKLFDLRDNVLLSYFEEHNLSTSLPIYQNLRALLNGHLRHTESLSIWEYIYFLKAAKKTDVAESLYQEIESKFMTDDDGLKRLVEQIRFDSMVILLLYMLETSLFCMILFIFYLMPKAIILGLIAKTSSAIQSSLKNNLRYAMEIMAVA